MLFYKKYFLFCYKKINKKIIKRKPYDFLNQLRKYKKNFIKLKNNGAEAPHYIATRSGDFILWQYILISPDQQEKFWIKLSH